MAKFFEIQQTEPWHLHHQETGSCSARQGLTNLNRLPLSSLKNIGDSNENIRAVHCV